MQKGLKKYFVNMDEYLASLGLYRKMLARDASCLFRAVSEQLYNSQHYHQKIRRECANYMRANRCNFEPFVQGSFEKYLERLEDPKETAGQVEIKALSSLYKRCFLIYRFPGKAATVITEEDFIEKVILCCSNNGHYDVVYPRQYPATAALCQALLYELLYMRVFMVEEADLYQALEAFRVGGRRYRNSPSACSDGDLCYDTPDDPTQREDWELGGAGGSAEDKHRAPDDCKPGDPAVPGPGGRLGLPYKVLKSLDTELYRNLEFDVWHDTRKEMQKTDYMVFAGRQYFLGDKCQVRLEPKGKYYNAFIQEVGTHSAAVTVFIEELGEKHLVPLANLKPVNPVPAWNVAPNRKGDLEGESRSQRHHRHRYFRKSRGGGKGAELLLVTSSYGGRPSSQTPLPPRFQPAGPPRPSLHPPPPSPGAMTYDSYGPTVRPPRYSPASSTRFLNRHLIGPQLAYYHPGRRYYHGYDNYAFRSRRSRRQMASSINKDCQFGFPDMGEEERRDLEQTITYYQLETGSDDMFPPLPGQNAPPPMMGAPSPPSTSPYWVQRGPGPLPAPPPSKPSGTSSEDDQEDASTVEDQTEYAEEYPYAAQESGFQSPGVYSGTESTAHLGLQEGSHADSPPESITAYTFTPQVVKSAVISSPSSSSSSSSHTSPASHLPPPGHTHTVAMAIPASSQWLVNEPSEPLGPVLAPPPYSYDPNGNDLPRDCRVLQYYYNLGVQWYHQSCWQQAYTPPPEASYHYQTYPPHYLSPAPSQDSLPLHAGVLSAGPQQSAYLESNRTTGDLQTDTHSGPGLPLDGSAPLSSVTPAPPPTLLYQDQSLPPPLLPLPYETSPPSYIAAPPPPHPPYHQFPISWTPGPHPRLYCPAPNASHLVEYVTSPPHQHYIQHNI